MQGDRDVLDPVRWQQLVAAAAALVRRGPTAIFGFVVAAATLVVLAGWTG